MIKVVTLTKDSWNWDDPEIDTGLWSNEYLNELFEEGWWICDWKMFNDMWTFILKNDEHYLIDDDEK